MPVYYEPNPHTHPDKKPGLYDREEMNAIERERKAAIKEAAAGVVAESEKRDAAAAKAREDTVRAALEGAAKKEVEDLKAGARATFPGNDAEFESAWTNGLRDQVLSAEAVRRQRAIKADAAAYVRGRF